MLNVGREARLLGLEVLCVYHTQGFKLRDLGRFAGGI